MASIGDLEITVDELPEGRVVLRVRGELDLATVSGLEAALAETGTSPNLVVDLSECTFLDSSAVRVLLGTASRTEDGVGQVAVIAPDPGIRRTLEIASVDTVLPVYSALSDAP